MCLQSRWTSPKYTLLRIKSKYTTRFGLNTFGINISTTELLLSALKMVHAVARNTLGRINFVHHYAIALYLLVLRWEVDLETPQHISELNSAIAFLSLVHPKTMTCTVGFKLISRQNPINVNNGNGFFPYQNRTFDLQMTFLLGLGTRANDHSTNYLPSRHCSLSYST